MLKTLLITTALSGVIISGAIAQLETPTAPKDQSAAPKDSASASETKFVTSQGADQWVFTKFKGSDVLGPDNARIGSVSDLLFDGTGRIIGVVVGVGGFLGIGAKNVAIDMSAFNAVPAESGSNDSNNPPAGNANDPTNIKLKVAWTKEQLQGAPDFQYYKPPARTSSTPSPATTGAVPRPAAPASPRPQTQ
jgi:PRC-barrel domain protein